MKSVRRLGREYNMEILGASKKPTSVIHLSDSLNIPIETCYRCVSELTAVGLLGDGSTDEGNTPTMTRHRRTTDAVGIRFAPVPSPFAWTCVREAVGTDTSTLEFSTQTETRSQIRSVPTGRVAPNTAATTE